VLVNRRGEATIFDVLIDINQPFKTLEAVDTNFEFNGVKRVL
jgi:hypothetical protein